MSEPDFIRDSILLPASERVHGIYIGGDLRFLSQLQTFDGANLRIEHCYSCDEALRLIQSNELMPDIILSEYELFDSLIQLKIYDETINHTSLQARFFLLSGQVLTKEDYKKVISADIGDVLLKSAPMESIFERICYFISRPKNVVFESTSAHKKAVWTSLNRTAEVVIASLSLLVSAPILVFVGLTNKFVFRRSFYTCVQKVGRGFRAIQLYQLVPDGISDKNTIDGCNKRHNYTYTIGESSCSNCEQLGRPCSPRLVVDGLTVCENAYISQKNNQSLGQGKQENRHPDFLFLRSSLHSFLNCLPQLFNVIKGDLRIFGLRPLSINEAEHLTTDAECGRLMAVAGLIEVQSKIRL